jgi:hypothetical protein
MGHVVVGHCPHCGSPIYAPDAWWGVTPPPSTPSCLCRFNAQTVMTSSSNFTIDIPAKPGEKQ